MRKLAFLVPLLAVMSLNTVAQEDIQIEMASMEVMKGKKGNKNGPDPRIRKIVVEYMLEKGDVTVDELKLMKEAKAEEKKELKALRNSGDKEALRAKLKELREARTLRRKEIKAYVAEHEDLADAIKAKRKEIREKRRERKLVVNYMLDQGDITQEELRVMKQERKEDRKALRELRASGDEAAWQAMHAELHEEREELQQQIDNYIAENDDLAAEIETRRAERAAEKE